MKDKKECYRHRWRVGASKGVIRGMRLVKIGIWIWCEKCDRKILAYNRSDRK